MKNDQNMPKEDMTGITKVTTAHAEVNPTTYSGYGDAVKTNRSPRLTSDELIEWH